MFYLVAKNSKFQTDKWRFDNTDLHCSVALSKSNEMLLIHCKLKTNFIAKSQLLSGRNMSIKVDHRKCSR